MNKSIDLVGSVRFNKWGNHTAVLEVCENELLELISDPLDSKQLV